MAKQTENNVGIYLRLSKEDMLEGESLSIENQKMILTKFVHDKGWNLVSEYVDDGYSGTDFDRPGIQRLLADAQLGKINIVVVKDLSRFGRNYIEVGRYIDYIFPMNNIRFIALNDNVDTADRSSAALDMMPIINLFNEWHSSSTSKKIKAVFEASAKAGKYLGGRVPYGYDRSDDPNHLPVINPETAPVVKHIFELRLQGLSQRKISDRLNEEQILCPSEYYYQRQGKENPVNSRKLWSRPVVDRILHNPMYLGNLVQLKTTTVSHKNHKLVKKDEAEWVVVPNTHEAIITQEIWDRCREIDEERAIGRRTKTGDTKPLCALMYCADCGFRMKFSRNQKMRGTTTGNPHQIVVGSYNCGTYSLYGKTVCPTHYISQRTIEEIVLNDIRSMMQLVEEDEAKARKQFLARKQKQESQQISSDKEKLRKAKERIAELDGLMQSVYEDKVSGEIPASMCAKLLTKYETEQNALSVEVQEIEARQLMQKQDEHDVDEYISRLKKFRNAEYLTRQMCLELIDSVTVDSFERGKQERDIHIYYKFIDKGYTGKSDD